MKKLNFEPVLKPPLSLLAGGAAVALVLGTVSFLAGWALAGRPLDNLFTAGMLTLAAGLLASMKGGAKTPFGQFSRRPPRSGGKDASAESEPADPDDDDDDDQRDWEPLLKALRHWPLMLSLGGAVSVFAALLFG